MVSDDKIIAAVRKLIPRGSKFEIHDRPEYAGRTLCEVRYWNSREFDTAFVLHSEERIDEKFRNFDALVRYLDREHDTDNGVRLFISHAHKDEALARKLVVALELGMRVPPGAIRCTSVRGY